MRVAFTTVLLLILTLNANHSFAVTLNCAGIFTNSTAAAATRPSGLPGCGSTCDASSGAAVCGTVQPVSRSAHWLYPANPSGGDNESDCYCTYVALDNPQTCPDGSAIPSGGICPGTQSAPPDRCPTGGTYDEVAGICVQDPTDNSCESKTGGSFEQFCGIGQPCIKLTCELGCDLNDGPIDTSPSTFVAITYTYSGLECGDSGGNGAGGTANDDLATDGSEPPGTIVTNETTTTTTNNETNNDGSVTTTTNTTTVTQSSGSGTTGGGTGGGATAEEIGDELTEATPASTDYTGDMQAGTDTLNDLYDGQENELSNPNDFANTTNTNLITSLLPSSGCTGNISIPIFDTGQTLSVTCSDTVELRSVLSWLIMIFTALYLFHMITSRPT